ncbi:alpha-amylase family glycosyl hydrolase [Sphingomonas sp. BK235]|uniref:alpha-amylase family glycosyl hydrolase n=1 Tax=Sphingomonas sp. BK235 TaxID=2512131 RepID=UPI00104BF5AD|nr:alpha-amylase family glycosyl hydrolase [Sphingomonas sp. BK235]TCP34787.1 maltopentaose-forming alpha-amylase [Sphingomonas sp. BK235]
MTMEQRLAAIGPRLRRQLERLYGARGDTGELWAMTVALLHERAVERPAALVALDAARLADPDWFVRPDMLGYSTYVDLFAGTVAGLAERVPYLRDQGVRYLHLLALLKARAGDSDGGFAVADYLAVEPRLGDMDELERLTARLREANISLCVDLALNHTADDHVWAQAARAGDPFYRDFYIVVDAATAAARDAELPQVFPATAPGNFTAVPAMGGHVWTTFYPFQWDLDWRNPDVFLSILDVALRLANKGVEAFRLDSIAFLWKQPGTDCRNLPETHYIVRALRAALDIVAPATLLKAEAIVPTAFVPPYFGKDEGDGFEPECHLVYNNSLMVAGWVALAERSAALPAAIIAASGGLPRGANWLSYARCHDDIGWGSVLGDLRAIDPAPERRLADAAHRLEGADGGWGRAEPFQSDGALLHGSNGTLASIAGLEAARDADEREAAFRRIALLNALAIASGGLATTYMGDELGQFNDRSYRDDPERAHEGRWLHRPAMDWDAVDGAASRRIGGDLRALRAARVASGGAGAPTSLPTGMDALLGIGCGSDRVFLNFGAAALPLPAAGRDRLTGAVCDSVPGWGVAWLEGGR